MKQETIKVSDYSFVAEILGDKPVKYITQGEYQGEWFCIAETPEGNLRIYAGSFGSCSGCDWIEAEYMRSDDGNYDSILKEHALEFAKEQDKYDLDPNWRTMSENELSLHIATLMGGKSGWYQDDAVVTIRAALIQMKKDGAIEVGLAHKGIPQEVSTPM